MTEIRVSIKMLQMILVTPDHTALALVDFMLEILQQSDKVLLACRAIFAKNDKICLFVENCQKTYVVLQHLKATNTNHLNSTQTN